MKLARLLNGATQEYQTVLVVVVGSRVGSPFSSVAFPPLPTTVILVPSSLKLFVKLSLGTAD